MKKMEFKTDLKCNGCIERITSQMNSLDGIITWDVDLTKPEKILKIESMRDNEPEIISILREKGYTCEKIA
jgi:copper chaperone CopZ